MRGQAEECPGVLKQERATIEQVLERTSDIYRASECSEEQAGQGRFARTRASEHSGYGAGA